MARVGRQGVVTMEESRTAEDNLYVVEGMQFDRGYISPYFVTDPERMVRAHAIGFGTDVWGMHLGFSAEATSCPTSSPTPSTWCAWCRRPRAWHRCLGACA